MPVPLSPASRTSSGLPASSSTQVSTIKTVSDTPQIVARRHEPPHAASHQEPGARTRLNSQKRLRPAHIPHEAVGNPRRARTTTREKALLSRRIPV
jgi:hypothetical protein